VSRQAPDRSPGLVVEAISLLAMGAPIALLAAAGSALVALLLFGPG